MKKSKNLRTLLVLSLVACPIIGSAQDYSPFNSELEPNESASPPENRNGYEPVYSEGGDPISNLDSVFLLIRNNKRAIDNTGRLAIKNTELNQYQTQALTELILEYYGRYTQKEQEAKQEMCAYFNAPENENIPLHHRAQNAFELLETQDEMDARWRSIGDEFLVDLRGNIGEEAFQHVQEHRDGLIRVGAGTHPQSTREFILSLNKNIANVVENNCK